VDPISPATQSVTDDPEPPQQLARLPALRFLELTSDLAAAMDFEGRLVSVNPALARVLGTRPGAVDGLRARDIVHPDDQLRLLRGWRGLVEGSMDALDVEVRAGSDAVGWRWHLASITVDRNARLVYGIAQDITERREAEERLREAEERFRGAFEHAGIGMTITSLDGRFLRVNSEFARMVGRKTEDLVGVAVADLTHPDDREATLGAMRALAAGEIRRYRTEKRYLRPDGSAVWVGLNLVAVHDAEGGVSSFLAQMTDIHERRAAQEALADSERRFRTLAAASPAGIFAADADGRMRYVNERLTEIFAMPAEDLAGHGWLLRLDHPDRKRVITEGRRARKTHERASLDVRLRVHGEAPRWARIHMAPLSDGNGVVHSYIGTVEDVSREVEARSELAAREAEYRLLAEHSGDFLSRHAPDSTYRYASPVCATLMGLLPEALVGRRPDELDCVHAEDLELLSRAHRSLLAGEGTATVEYRVVHRDGTRRWVESAMRLVRGADGEPEEIVAVTRDINERKLAELELARQALHDGLTGLPNRALFLDRLGQALKRAQRRGSAVAVLFLDLDRFKNVNDSLGHDAGDRLLIDVAARLRRSLRPADTLARFGGDELTLLCDDIAGEADARTIAERIAELFREPFRLDDGEAYLQASVGIALSTTGTEQPEDLIRDADAAMYRAKERGRARVEVFDQQLREVAADRLSTESALRRALQRDELRLHFQPLVSLADGSVEGVEALVRWEHPDRGLLMPGAFIELAEETGLIVPLGEWVLRRACATLQGWRERHDVNGLQVAVNVSARHLQQPDLVDTVREALRETGLPGDRLIIEITESAVMERGAAVTATLAELKDLGVRLAIDDFGTGYSSLAHLHRFPLDVLKIDRGFVADLGSGLEAPIAAAIVSLAQALGLRTVAEGIERPEQRDAVRALGCDLAQGFLFAKPLPPDEAEALIA
jgi:diguanylate cyclase (GGDEF)-like protein/PAS domain S-box-containing protein